MTQLRLEPYAVQQRWEFPAPQPGSVWQQILSTYVMDLARVCASQAGSGPTPVIGHIKLLALFPGGGYLRISAVSPGHPSTSTGQVPDGLAHLTLTLNVLVYGLAREVLQSLTRSTAAALAAINTGQVIEEGEHGAGQSTFPGLTDHPHHHHAE